MASINTHTQETSSDLEAQTNAADDGVARKRRKVGTATSCGGKEAEDGSACQHQDRCSAEEVEGRKGRHSGSADGGDRVAGSLGARIPLGHREEEARSFAHQRDGKDGVRRYRIDDKAQALTQWATTRNWKWRSPALGGLPRRRTRRALGGIYGVPAAKGSAARVCSREPSPGTFRRKSSAGL